MRVYIGIPCGYGRVRLETVMSLTSSISFLQKQGMEVILDGVLGCEIASAREGMVERALEAEADWVVMVDDDMSWDEDLIYKLIQNSQDICVPLMHQRRYPFAPVIFKLIPKDETKAIFKDKYQPILNLQKALTSCDGVGFGVIVIKASVFTRILMRPWFAQGPNFGEDLFFCSRAREFGIKPHYDGRLQVTHYGDPLAVNTNWLISIGAPAKLEEANA